MKHVGAEIASLGTDINYTSSTAVSPLSCLGTYRCDVQDKNFRRVKRAYWGIRVLPSGIFDLDYEGTLSKWDNWQNQTMTHLQDYKTVLIYMVGKEKLIWFLNTFIIMLPGKQVGNIQDITSVILIIQVLIPLSFAGAVVGLMVGLYWAMKTGKLRYFNTFLEYDHKKKKFFTNYDETLIFHSF